MFCEATTGLMTAGHLFFLRSYHQSILFIRYPDLSAHCCSSESELLLRSTGT